MNYLNKTQLIMDRYDYPNIKDLGFVRPITNSEALQLACSRSYTFEYVECFESEGINENFAFGACWHSLLEYILLQIKETEQVPKVEEIKDWISKNLKSKIIEEYFKTQNISSISKENLTILKDSIFDRIYFSIEGWLYSWKKFIHPKYKIVDVEMLVYHPIMFKREIFKSDINLIKEIYPSEEEGYKEKHVYRQLLSGEKKSNIQSLPIDCLRAELVNINMPYYKVGKIDALLVHREHDSLWILDHKTSKSISSYERKTQYNLQLNGYAALVHKMLENGYFDHIEESRFWYVGGVIWDLCSSDISSKKIPELLKSNKLSKSKTRTSPSWLYKEAIQRYNLDENEYKDHLDFLKLNDNKFFMIKEEHISKSELLRCLAEDYSIALRLDKIRKDIEGIDFNDPFDWNLKSPRYTICSQYGSCKFSNNCFANAKANDIYLKRQQKISWIEHH